MNGILEMMFKGESWLILRLSYYFRGLGTKFGPGMSKI